MAPTPIETDTRIKVFLLSYEGEIPQGGLRRHTKWTSSGVYSPKTNFCFVYSKPFIDLFSTSQF